jgi:methyl-accepting chemotaxis protein
VFVVLFFISGLLYLDQYEKRLEDKLLAQGKMIVRLSNLVIVDDIVNYNDISLLSHIEKIESVDNVVYAMILSNKGVVLGHSDVYEIGTVYTDKLSKWAITTKDFTYKEYLDNGKPILVCASPIVDKELGTVAFIRFGLSKNIITESMQKEKKNLLIFCVIFYVIFIIIFCLFFYTEISRPLGMIKDGVYLLKDNITSLKFKIKQKDEIGELYSNINSFIAQVSDMKCKINENEDKILDSEEYRLEKVITILKQDSDVLIANNENKVIFSKILFQDFLKEDSKGFHIMDALKNTDLISILTEAYSNKTEIVKQEITIGLSKYIVNIFLLEQKAPFFNKTILIINRV